MSIERMRWLSGIESINEATAPEPKKIVDAAEVIEDPDLQEAIKEFAELLQEKKRLKAELAQVEKRSKELAYLFEPVFKQLDRVEIRVGNAIIKLAREGYESVSIPYKQLYEWLEKRVNRFMRAIVNNLKAELATTRKYAPQFDVRVGGSTLVIRGQRPGEEPVDTKPVYDALKKGIAKIFGLGKKAVEGAEGFAKLVEKAV